jgi:phospholipase C
MPEHLQAPGISWKVYGNADGNYGDNVLPYFKRYWSDPALAANGLVPSYPAPSRRTWRRGRCPRCRGCWPR